MFIGAHIQLGTMPFPVAQQRLAAYALYLPALRRDSQAALREGLGRSDGDLASATPIDVLNAPVRHHPRVTMMPLRWRRRAAPEDEMPLVDANVEVVNAGRRTVRLTAVGSYRPRSRAAAADVIDAAERTAEVMLRPRPLSSWSCWSSLSRSSGTSMPSTVGTGERGRPAAPFSW